MHDNTLNHSQGFINRRQLLQTAGGGIGSWALSHLFNADQVRAEEEGSSPLAAKLPHHKASAKSVIFIFAYGGPSQVDMFDYKPL